MKVSRAIFFAGLFAAATSWPVHAAIWDGGLAHGDFTLNGLWSTGNNWQDVIPVSGPATDVVFVLSGIRTTATQNLANPFTLRSLTFSPGSNVVAVTGDPLNFANGGSIAQNSAVSAVVSNAIIWNGTGVVTGIGTAELALAATMSGLGAVRYVGGAGGTTLFVKVGGANTYAGGTLVGESAGGYSPVDVTFAANTAAGPGSIQFFNGNTIRGGNGARTFANQLGLSSNANGLGNVFTFGSGDDMTFTGPIVVTNVPQTLDVENAVTTFAGNLTGSASLTKTGPGKLVLNGANAGLTLAAGAQNTLKAIAVENGTMDLDGSRTTLDAGVTVGATAAVPAMNLVSGGFLACGSNAGSIVSGPPGTSLNMAGGFQWNAGFQLVIAAGFGPGFSSGVVNVRSAAFLNGTFMIVGAGGPDGVGTLNIESQGSVLSSAGIVGFTGGSAGHVVITGASSKWTNSVSLGIGGFSSAQSGGVGNVTVADGAILEVQGTTTFWTAGGKIDVKGGQYFTRSLVTNALTNATVALSDPDDDHSALTLGAGGDSTTFPGTISNGSSGPGGITKVDGGTVTFTGPLSFTGPIRVFGGKLVVPQSFPFATITHVANGSSLEFTGTWGTNTFSQTTIASGSTLVASGTLKGSVTNSGVIEVSAGKNLAMTGSVVNHGVMRFKTGATFSASGTLVNHGVIDVITAGGFTPPPGFVNNGLIIDRTSIITSITKLETLVTVGSPKLYGGHVYQLQAGDSPGTAFVGIGVPFTVNSDQPISTNLGEIVPQRFYRWKVD